MMVLLLLSTRKCVFIFTNKQEAFRRVVGMDGVVVVRGMTLQGTNNCSVVRAHHSSLGYRVFWPSLYQVCPRMPPAIKNVPVLL